MTSYRLLIAVLLMTSLRLAEAALPFLSETVSWDEDVLLRDGSVLLVHRTVTYGADEFGRSGRGALKEQTMSFSSRGGRVKWSSDEKWPIIYMPDIFDFVEGNPVIVMPVYRFGPCKKFGFPQEGMVGFMFRDNRWETISTAQFPKTLKVNLLRSTHHIQYSPEYKGKRIGQAERHNLQGTTRGARLGDSIELVAKFYSEMEDSCSRIQPLPNPQLDVAKRLSIDAASNAKTLSATVTDLMEKAETVSAARYAEAMGPYRGVGRVSERCNGVVKLVEPLRIYNANGGWSLVGHLLITGDEKTIPIQQANLAVAQAPAQLEQVICDANTIYAIRRANKSSLIIHRFRHSGEVIDALSVVLPDTEKVVPGNGWGDVWDVTITDGRLSLAIANYTYPALANRGGTISQKQTYTVNLP